jgi:hypothetical protein
MALRVEDVLSIHKLLADYNHAVDRGDGDAFAAMFVDDGSLRRGAEVTKGSDDLRDFARGLPPGIRHLATNVSIDGDGDDATTRAYLQVWSTKGGAAESRLLVSGIYADTLVRDGDAWRFVTRVLTYDS